MKKFFDRLRRWLIKKLGGYTEQFTPVRHEIIQMPEVAAKKVRVQMVEHRPAMIGNIGTEKYLKRKAAESIATFLEENGFIEWKRADNLEKNLAVFEATIYAVSVKDLEPRFRESVEVHGY